MDKETLAALKESIKIWTLRASGKIVNESCPLCALAQNKKPDEIPSINWNACKDGGCILDKTNICSCNGIFGRWSNSDPRSPSIAQEMVDALKKFLPEEPKEEEPKPKMAFILFEVGDLVETTSNKRGIISRFDGTYYYLALDGWFAHNLKLIYPRLVVEAIKGSWKKWDKTYKGELSESQAGYRNNCPLCVMFFGKTAQFSCGDCPIHLKSTDGCSNTPFGKWCDDKTSQNALAFRDWIGELLPVSVVEELMKESEPKKKSSFAVIDTRTLNRDGLFYLLTVLSVALTLNPPKRLSRWGI